MAAVLWLVVASFSSLDSAVGVAELSDVTMVVCPLAAVETAVLALSVCEVVDPPVVVVELDSESEYVGTSFS
jgi:hypothetical protein